jgi:hypothetical protein
VITLLSTFLALKLVEGTGSLEFDGWDGLIGATIACWLGGWAAQAVWALVFIDPQAVPSPDVNPWLTHSLLAISYMISLLLASAVLPSVHVRNFFGVVLAAILVTGFNYLAIMLMSATVGSLL